MMGCDSERVIGPSCTIRAEYIENCPYFKQADSSPVLRNQIEGLYLIDGRAQRDVKYARLRTVSRRGGSPSSLIGVREVQMKVN